MQDGPGALVARFFQDVVSGQALDAAEGLCTPDYRHHDPSLVGEEVRGLDRFLETVRTFFDAFPGCRVMVKSMVAAGDKVGVEWTRQGAPRAGLKAMDTPHEKVDFISTHRVEGDRIAESWVFFHLAGAEV